MAELPIIGDGGLLSDAPLRVLGTMSLPECGRSTLQFAKLFEAEFRAKALDPNYRPGTFLQIVYREAVEKIGKSPRSRWPRGSPNN
jgi:hypothetical protein